MPQAVSAMLFHSIQVKLEVSFKRTLAHLVVRRAFWRRIERLIGFDGTWVDTSKIRTSDKTPVDSVRAIWLYAYRARVCILRAHAGRSKVRACAARRGYSDVATVGRGTVLQSAPAAPKRGRTKPRGSDPWDHRHETSRDSWSLQSKITNHKVRHAPPTWSNGPVRHFVMEPF